MLSKLDDKIFEVVFDVKVEPYASVYVSKSVPNRSQPRFLKTAVPLAVFEN